MRKVGERSRPTSCSNQHWWILEAYIIEKDSSVVGSRISCELLQLMDVWITSALSTQLSAPCPWNRDSSPVSTPHHLPSIYCVIWASALFLLIGNWGSELWKYIHIIIRRKKKTTLCSVSFLFFETVVKIHKSFNLFGLIIYIYILHPRWERISLLLWRLEKIL